MNEARIKELEAKLAAHTSTGRGRKVLNANVATLQDQIRRERNRDDDSED
jgi:uncharacterized coiled-coil protein SlyX